MAKLVRSLRAAVAAPLVAGMLMTAPLTVSAHVNRVVGPYTFFIVLIEEPFFATNRAGFEFWVHDGARPIEGLDGTLKAQAINSTRNVDLVVSPVNDRGFYDVEIGMDEKPFDPGGGGQWSLRLIGSVEGLAVDESFVTNFPAYPRLAGAAPSGSSAMPAPVPADIPVLE